MSPYPIYVCDFRFCLTNKQNFTCDCNADARRTQVFKSSEFQGKETTQNPDAIDFAWRQTAREIEAAEAEHVALLSTTTSEALRRLDEATDPAFDRRARERLRNGLLLEKVLRMRSERLAAPAIALGLV